VCPLHKSTFCIPSGRCRNGPAEGGIKVDIDRT
jgi:nitrite reductase/ring-hydroxylating ferredoxin subunit